MMYTERYDVNMISNNDKLNKVIQECGETGVELPESMLSVTANLLCSSRLSWSVFPTFIKSIQIEYDTEDSYTEFEIFDDKIIMLRMTGDHVDDEREVTLDEMHYIVWGLEK